MFPREISVLSSTCWRPRQTSSSPVRGRRRDENWGTIARGAHRCTPPRSIIWGDEGGTFAPRGYRRSRSAIAAIATSVAVVIASFVALTPAHADVSPPTGEASTVTGDA